MHGQHNLRLDGIEKGALVAVAMSGGVDSSVAAALLVEAGYNVIGITLQLYDHGALLLKKGACCAGQDIYDARTVADTLGFPHYVLDFESVFQQSVMDDFADSYLRGETPLPCVRCNQRVKFRDLLNMSKDLGATCLVTGHYVQRFMTSEQGIMRSELHRAIDPVRDQSYFLFATTQEQLNYLRFPLGGMEKSETRAHAKRFNLKVSDKPDSQDICFVPHGNYATVVEKMRPGALDPGDIVDETGRLLGAHQGIINYTIGQRRGLGIAHPEPLFVVALNPEKRQVIVGPKESLAKTNLALRDVNFLCDDAVFEREGYKVEIKIRSSQTPIPATVVLKRDGKTLSDVHVILDMPEYGVAPGQACVFYNNGRVLGGGWIDRTS